MTIRINAQLERAMPDAEKVGRARPRNVTFICQGEERRSATNVLADILAAANDVTGEQRFTCSLSSQIPATRGMNWRQHTVFFVGGYRERWKLAPNDIKPLKHILTSAGHIVLTGSAVFLPAAVGLSPAETLAIHPNFIAPMAEECPDVSVSSRAITRNERYSSAITPVAAQKLLIELISDDLGEYTSRSVAAYVGLAEQPDLPATNDTWKYVQSSRGDALVCDILDLMKSHIEEPLSIADISEITGTSVRNIQRRFKQKTRTSPQFVYREIRLQHARKLVSQSNIPMIDVALASGFQTCGALQENFKKHFGKTPSQIRKEQFFGCDAGNLA